jgi:WD40 repeat protein
MILLQAARERVEVLQFSPDGRILVAPCGAGLQVWNNLAAGSGPDAVLCHPHVRSARFTPDGRKVLLGCFWRVVVHDLRTGKDAEVPLELTSAGCSYCELTPDGQYLVVAQGDTRLDPPGRVCCRPLSDLATAIWSITTRWMLAPPLFLAGGKRFVLFECWSEPRPWSYHRLYVNRDTLTGLLLSEAEARGDEFHNPVISPEQRMLAGRRGAWVAVLSADDLGAQPTMFRNDNRKEFTGLAFHPSGRYLAATSNDATVKLYDTSTWKVAQSFNWEIGRLRSVAFSPDGMLAAAGGDKGKIVVWDVDL